MTITLLVAVLLLSVPGFAREYSVWDLGAVHGAWGYAIWRDGSISSRGCSAENIQSMYYGPHGQFREQKFYAVNYSVLAGSFIGGLLLRRYHPKEAKTFTRILTLVLPSVQTVRHLRSAYQWQSFCSFP